VSSAVVVEKLAVELPSALQDSLCHSSLTLELVGLLVGNSFAALEGSGHFDYCSRRSWGGFTILDCMCWSMGCAWEDNCSVPHNLLALDLQRNTKDKCR
jgi:hypothetical protein